MQDVQQRRDLKAGQEEWTAWVVVMVGTTVVHLWALMPELTKAEASEIVKQCTQYARAYIAKPLSDSEVTGIRRKCAPLLSYERHPDISRCHYRLVWQSFYFVLVY